MRHETVQGVPQKQDALSPVIVSQKPKLTESGRERQILPLHMEHYSERRKGIYQKDSFANGAPFPRGRTNFEAEHALMADEKGKKAN